MRYVCLTFSVISFLLCSWVFSMNWNGAKAIAAADLSGAGPVNAIYGRLFGCLFLIAITIAVNYVKTPPKVAAAVTLIAFSIVAYLLTTIDAFVYSVSNGAIDVSAADELNLKLRQPVRVIEIAVAMSFLINIAALFLAGRSTPPITSSVSVPTER